MCVRGCSVFGRSKRRHADELRARFVANREKVRSWVADWHCPEITWPEVPAIPAPWVVAESNEQAWFEQHAPFMDQYRWFLEARPLADGISQVQGLWWFAERHEFERLDIQTTTVADPGYLAEMLTSGVHAAALEGWRETDAQPVHEWLLEGLDSRPMEHGVTGKNRSGFILLDFARFPHSRTEINVRLSLTMTGTALDGTPLDDNGEPIPR